MSVQWEGCMRLVTANLSKIERIALTVKAGLFAWEERAPGFDGFLDSGFEAICVLV